MLRDGSVLCWGSNTDWEGNEIGQATPPDGDFTSVSAGYAHTCGVLRDGSALCWGFDGGGEATPPEGEFASVSAGGDHSVACWGAQARGVTQADFPATQ